MARPPVLVTVAPLVDYPGCIPTEPLCRYLAPALLAAGERVRILAEGEQASNWPGDVEVIAGSITRPADSPAAFAGIGAIFLAGADPMTAYEALAMARAGGAAKVVNLSSHGPEFEIAMSPDSWHWLAIEVVVERSGLKWTHIVPSLIMAITLTGSYPLAVKSWRALMRSGEPIRRPFAHAPFPFLHEKDLAALVVQALQEQAFNGQTIHASGRLLSDLERLKTLRAVLGREIAFEALSREQAQVYYQTLGMDEHDIAYVLDTAAWFAEHAEESHAEAERILGRPLLCFEEWVREHVADFA